MAGESGAESPEAAARRSRRLRASAAQLDRILDAVGEAVTITEADGRLIFANAPALERMGIATLEEALAAAPDQLLGRFEITREDGAPLNAADLPGRRLLRGEPADPMLLRLVERGTGRLIWTIVKATVFRDEDGLQLAVNVLEDVTQPKEQELRARFLSRASEVFATSLDYPETMRQVAQLAVPEIADWCSVEMLDDGEIRQVAVAHKDPAKLAFAREFRERYPPSLEESAGIGAVLRTGEPEFYPTIPEEVLVSAAREAEHARLLRELQMRSVIVVPMRSRGRIIGAISFVAAEMVGAFDEDDLVFAQNFAARAAAAIENARLYHERSETVRTLQASLLPRQLPQVIGWRFATFYRPAAPADQIGGDFYDLFPLDEGFTVVLGDVTGKGLNAATLTALARHSTGAAALLGLSPGEILSLLNRVLLTQGDLSLVTTVVAKIVEDGDGVRVSSASAGHPMPLCHRLGEPPQELCTPGPLLGLDADGHWPETTMMVEPGDTLLFYTDGITDTRGIDDRFGDIRLRTVLAAAPAEPELLVREIELALQDFETGQARDDSAILAAQLLPRSATMTAPAGEIRLVRPE